MVRGWGEHNVDRRQVLRLTSAGFGGSLAAMSGQYARAAQEGDASTVRLLLDWKANATHAGCIVAKQRGFYEDEGLSITIDSGEGGLSTAKQVGLQKYTFGLTSAAAVLQTRANDLDIRSYAAAQQGPNSTVYTTADAFGGTLSDPEQLAGKTIAVPAAASNLAVLKAILEQRGVLDAVDFLNVGWGQLTPSVLSGDADAALGAFPDGIALEREGYDSSMLWLMDHVPTVGRSIAAHPTLAADNPETLRAFLRATAKGWAWASNRPEAAMDLLIDAHSRLRTTRELGILKIKYTAQKLILTETVRQHGWGHQPAESWQTVAEILENAETIPSSLDVTNAWTNDYLDTDAPYVGNYGNHVSLDYDVV